MGQPCNISADFITQYTDFGMCYTFNWDATEVKYVDDTAYALSLILNVEQYEHMRGPQSDAGIKVRGRDLIIYIVNCHSRKRKN